MYVVVLHRFVDPPTAFARGESDLVVRKVYVNKYIEELRTQLGAAVQGRGIELDVDAHYDGVAYFEAA